MDRSTPTTLPARLLRYALERFPPRTHLSYAVLLCAAMGLVSLAATGVEVRLSLASIPTLAVVLLALFHLRLLDDIKDFGKDQRLYPRRPLPRGLLSVKEAALVAISCMVVETLLSLAFRPQDFAIVLVFIGYSLLMYVGFFARDWVESHVVIFVASHTAAALPLSLVIFALWAARPFWSAPTSVVLLALAQCFLSAGYDFSRKLKAPDESGYVESYNRLLGPTRSAILVFVALAGALGATLATGVLLRLGAVLYFAWAGLLLHLLIVTLLYLKFPRRRTLLACRLTGIAFSAVVNIVVIAGVLWQ
jgi:4-hydroxybenzoate polyprenyltransferase